MKRLTLILSSNSRSAESYVRVACNEAKDRVHELPEIEEKCLG